MLCSCTWPVPGAVGLPCQASSSCGNRHKGFLLQGLPGLIANKLLIPLGSKETQSSRWNFKPQHVFISLSCIPSSAWAVGESTPFPPYKPPQIFYFNCPSLFFPYSTTSFLQQQLKKYPCPDLFFVGDSSGFPWSGHSWGQKASWSPNSLGNSPWTAALVGE